MTKKQIGIYTLLAGILLLIGVIGGMKQEAPTVRVLRGNTDTETFSPEWEAKQQVMYYLLEHNAIDPDEALGIACSIVYWSLHYNIDYKVVAAILTAESGGQNTAGRIDRDDTGLMQVNKRYWRKPLIENEIISHEQDLWNPHLNVKAGCWIYSRYLQQTSDTYRAIVAYNGMNKGDKYLNQVVSNIYKFK